VADVRGHRRITARCRGTTPAGLPGRPGHPPAASRCLSGPKPRFGMNDSDYAEAMRYASVPTERERDAEMVRAAAAAIPLVDDAPAYGDHAQPAARA
jgi:hypothetical protein